MESTINKHSVKWGLIISVVYCVFLFLRYEMGESNPLIFSGLAFVGYVIILVLMLVSGFQIRKKLGGYIELQQAFKAIFIAVLIFELAYAVFNFIYLKYINPDFFLHLRDSTERMLTEAGQSQSEIDKVINSIDVDAPRKMGIFDVLKSYLVGVAITGALAFLMALIIKKKPDAYMQKDFLDTNNQ